MEKVINVGLELVGLFHSYHLTLCIKTWSLTHRCTLKLHMLHVEIASVVRNLRPIPSCGTDLYDFWVQNHLWAGNQAWPQSIPTEALNAQRWGYPKLPCQAGPGPGYKTLPSYPQGASTASSWLDWSLPCCNNKYDLTSQGHRESEVGRSLWRSSCPAPC